MVATMGSIYRLESMMTAMAMAAYGSQVKRKANTIATTIRATCTSMRFVLPPSDTFNLVTWDTKQQAERPQCKTGTSKGHLFTTECILQRSPDGGTTGAASKKT